MPFAIVQIVLLSALGTAWLLRPDAPLIAPPDVVRHVGLGAWVVGALLCVLGLRDLGDALRIHPEPRADAPLVDRGIYCTLRHPMYTGIAFIVCGMIARRPSATVIVLGIALVTFYVVKGRYEERLLEQRHGDAYRSYRERTRGVLLVD